MDQFLLQKIQILIKKFPLYGDLNKNFYVKPIEKPEFGDFYSNILLINKGVHEFRGFLAQELRTIPEIENIDFTNLFVNIKFVDRFYIDYMKTVVLNNIDYSHYCKSDDIHPINVEFGSINITGPAHIGHARNLQVGISISNLLKKTGHVVIKEYYVNDQGNQFYTFVESLWQNGRNLTPTYRGEYTNCLTNEMIDEIKSYDLSEFKKLYGKPIVDRVLKDHKKTLRKMNAFFDYFTFESEMENHRDALMSFLCKKKIIFKINTNIDEEKSNDIIDSNTHMELLEKWDHCVEGKIIIKLVLDQCSYFVLRRSDKTWTYFGNDIVFFWHKIMRGSRRLITVLGEDHYNHANKLRSFISEIDEGVETQFISFSMVHLEDQDHNIRKMSKREGNILTVDEIGDLIGFDSLKFLLILYSKNSPIKINLNQLIENKNHDHLLYIKYAYARICSLFRNFEKINQKSVESYVEENLENQQYKNIVFVHDVERLLVVHLSYYGFLIRQSVDQLSVNLIAEYAKKLSVDFNSWWSLGVKDPEMRFLSPNINPTRFMIIITLKRTLEHIMSIFEIKLSEEI